MSFELEGEFCGLNDEVSEVVDKSFEVSEEGVDISYRRGLHKDCMTSVGNFVSALNYLIELCGEYEETEVDEDKIAISMLISSQVKKLIFPLPYYYKYFETSGDNKASVEAIEVKSDDSKVKEWDEIIGRLNDSELRDLFLEPVLVVSCYNECLKLLAGDTALSLRDDFLDGLQELLNLIDSV